MKHISFVFKGLRLSCLSVPFTLCLLMSLVLLILYSYTSLSSRPVAFYYASPFCQFFVLFGEEGPHTRRYGRTTALRLLVQPWIEDKDDDCFFVLFQVTEHRWNETDR